MRQFPYGDGERPTLWDLMKAYPTRRPGFRWPAAMPLSSAAPYRASILHRDPIDGDGRPPTPPSLGWTLDKLLDRDSLNRQQSPRHRRFAHDPILSLWYVRLLAYLPREEKTSSSTPTAWLTVTHTLTPLIKNELEDRSWIIAQWPYMLWRQTVWVLTRVAVREYVNGGHSVVDGSRRWFGRGWRGVGYMGRSFVLTSLLNLTYQTLEQYTISPIIDKFVSRHAKLARDVITVTLSTAVLTAPIWPGLALLNHNPERSLMWCARAVWRGIVERPHAVAKYVAWTTVAQLTSILLEWALRRRLLPYSRFAEDEPCGQCEDCQRRMAERGETTGDKDTEFQITPDIALLSLWHNMCSDVLDMLLIFPLDLHNVRYFLEAFDPERAGQQNVSAILPLVMQLTFLDASLALVAFQSGCFIWEFVNDEMAILMKDVCRNVALSRWVVL